MGPCRIRSLRLLHRLEAGAVVTCLDRITTLLEIPHGSAVALGEWDDGEAFLRLLAFAFLLGEQTRPARACHGTAQRDTEPARLRAPGRIGSITLVCVQLGLDPLPQITG